MDDDHFQQEYIRNARALEDAIDRGKKACERVIEEGCMQYLNPELPTAGHNLKAAGKRFSTLLIDELEKSMEVQTKSMSANPSDRQLRRLKSRVHDDLKQVIAPFVEHFLLEGTLREEARIGTALVFYQAFRELLDEYFDEPSGD